MELMIDTHHTDEMMVPLFTTDTDGSKMARSVCNHTPYHLVKLTVSWSKHEGTMLLSITSINPLNLNSISELKSPKDLVRLLVMPFVHLPPGGSLLFSVESVSAVSIVSL
jgi:hypothetical protein